MSVVFLLTRWRLLAAVGLVLCLPFARRPKASAGESHGSQREGPLPVPTAIRFKGNHHIPADQLRALLKTKVGQPVDVQTLKRDVDRIVAAYEDRGFLRARVTADLEPEDGKQKGTLIITAVEGPRYKVRRILIEGNALFAEEELLALIDAEREGFFSVSALKASARRVYRHYARVGRVTTAVRPVMRRADALVPELDAVFLIREGPKATLEGVDIEWEGEPRTNKRVILRELKLAAGQPVTLPMVESGIARLRKRRWFKTLRYEFRAGRSPENVRLVVIVQEGPTTRLGIGGSAASYTGLGGSLQFTERNFDATKLPASWQDVKEWNMFRGGGDALSLALTASERFSSVGVSYEHPHLLGTENTLLASTGFRMVDRDDYDHTHWRGRLGLARSLDEHWQLALGPAVQTTTISDLARFDVPDVVEAKGYTMGYGLWSRLTYSTIGEAPVPHKGFRARLSVDAMSVDTEFARLSVAATKLFPLWGEGDDAHVLEVSGRIGSIVGEAPFYERFYCGGPGSVRGFQTRGIGPRQVDVRVGGGYLATARAEYGCPLLTVTDDVQLRGVAFIDAGEAEEHLAEMGWFRVGSGVGLRLVIPQLGGTVAGIDFAWPLASKDEDDEQVVSFFIGVRL